MFVGFFLGSMVRVGADRHHGVVVYKVPEHQGPAVVVIRSNPVQVEAASKLMLIHGAEDVEHPSADWSVKEIAAPHAA